VVQHVLVGAVLVLVAAVAVAAAPAVSAYTRTASAGGVDVKVIYASAEYFAAAKDGEGAKRFAPEKQVVFLVAMDTHAGDLMAFDVVRNSRLRTVAGGATREYAPVRWESTSDGSHHRSGALIFPASVNGTKVIGPAVTSIALVIADLAGVPARTFEWALPIR